jgi:threonine/homoserine/homoserine lactone efflux protein
MSVNAGIIVGAGSIARFLSNRPRWAAWQRRMTGTMLGLVTVLLAREIPARARI